jgi:hypothetical protein
MSVLAGVESESGGRLIPGQGAGIPQAPGVIRSWPGTAGGGPSISPQSVSGNFRSSWQAQLAALTSDSPSVNDKVDETPLGQGSSFAGEQRFSSRDREAGSGPLADTRAATPFILPGTALCRSFATGQPPRSIDLLAPGKDPSRAPQPQAAGDNLQPALEKNPTRQALPDLSEDSTGLHSSRATERPVGKPTRHEKLNRLPSRLLQRSHGHSPRPSFPTRLLSQADPPSAERPRQRPEATTPALRRWTNEVLANHR